MLIPVDQGKGSDAGCSGHQDDAGADRPIVTMRSALHTFGRRDIGGVFVRLLFGASDGRPGILTPQEIILFGEITDRMAR
jgi:hypothetical protein